MLKVVSNSTPIISLSMIQRLSILEELYSEIYIPNAVFEELSISGTLGVLLKAKEKGIIKKLSPLMDALIQNGIYIDSKLYKLVLKVGNE